jgi:hypothetical protein
MKAIYALSLLLLSSCVGGTFGNHTDIEEYPLRTASTSESNKLKRCLKAAHFVQEKHRQKTGELYKRTSEMPVDSYCQGFMLAQNRTKNGYEIMAQFHEGESTVRWTVNQAGVIEEHLDSDYDGEIGNSLSVEEGELDFF